MPVLNGLETTRQLCKYYPTVRIVVLTMHTNEEYIFQYLQAGAKGYLVKQSAPTELLAAIHAVYQGQSFLSPAISKTVIDEYLRQLGTNQLEQKDEKLTAREREVLQLLAEGHSNRQIAEQLHLSVKTVGVHRMNLMKKLEIHDITELTRYALRKGMIALDQ